jgi:hypothetical protein
MTRPRPRIAIVTRTWGDDGDAASIARLVAGALATRGDVEIVHLGDVDRVRTTTESVFTVHSVPLVGAQPVRSAIVRAAVEGGGGRGIPGAVTDLLERWEGAAPSTPAVLQQIDPTTVLLIGSSQPFDLTALGRARTVFIPMTGRTGVPATDQFAALVDAADVVASIHPGEQRDLLLRYGERAAITPLDVALPLNRNATDQGLFGVGWFGRYVVLIRRFPADGGRYAHSVTHDVMRGALGSIAVAEVDGTKWRIADDQNTAELPVNPTRVNLWRLMANASATIDLRPPDVFGRETVESMMLGTPVVVPAGSAAMEHAAAASGGLWYENLGEVLGAARAVLDEPVRVALGRQGRAYAESHHGDMDAFVARIATLAGV